MSGTATFTLSRASGRFSARRSWDEACVELSDGGLGCADLRKMPLTLTQVGGGRVRLPPTGARRQVWLEQRRKARAVALGNSGNTRPSDLTPRPCFRLRPERVDIIGHPTFLHPADEQFGRELPHRVWTEFPHHVWIEAIYLHEAELELALDFFLVQVTRPLRTCWITALSQYTKSPQRF